MQESGGAAQELVTEWIHANAEPTDDPKTLEKGAEPLAPRLHGFS